MKPTRRIAAIFLGLFEAAEFAARFAAGFL
jgi:hypothetical protein